MRAALVAAVLVGGSAAAQGRFTPAGQLGVSRTAHTATLLQDGRVLVVGGRSTDGLTVLGSTELFDPRKGTWTPGPPLARGRSHHSATLLPDGRVVVVGGTALEGEGEATRFVALASSELFEPSKRKWVPGPALAEARNGHSATLMPDGAVLVAGGAREQRLQLASVERLVPPARAFEPVPSLTVPRWWHAAVLLADGSVVVVGGRSSTGAGPAVVTDAVERYAPDGGRWTPAPAMSEPRQRMGAYAVGTTVTVVGGQTRTSTTNLAERWSPGEASWTGLDSSLSMGLSSHSATVLPSGDVLVVGGEPPTSLDTSRAQRWSERERRWCLAGALAVSRKSHTATLLKDGRVLVVGGTSGGVPERTAEVWADAPGPCEEPPGL